MPDPAPDLLALAAQIKFLSGDLNRRFELLSGGLSSSREELSSSVNQLNSRMDALSTRMDTLSTSRKVVVPFKPALDGGWLEGSTSPPVDMPGNIPDSVTFGNMFVVLPNLSRIGVFRASVRISDAVLNAQVTLTLSLQSTVVDARPEEGFQTPENVVPLRFPFVPGIADRHGHPILGTEFVDNDRFKYSVNALFAIERPGGAPILVPQGTVVFESFEVDCIVA